MTMHWLKYFWQTQTLTGVQTNNVITGRNEVSAEKLTEIKDTRKNITENNKFKR